LAGGVGAAKFLRGLIRTADPATLTVVVNTGDDERFYGLAVSPDLDTTTYTLAGVANPRTGWGRRGDTFTCLAALERFTGPAWFQLGDRDLATHIHRSARLAAGATLARVTDEIRKAFGVRARILPMSNDRVRTVIDTARGALPFQRYLVAERARPRPRGVRYLGAARARAAPGVLRALRDADAVIVAPSNPFLSIGPILAVPGIRAALTRRRGPVIAVSPLVGGRAVSGPLVRLLRAAELPATSLGIARCYRPFLDALVIDRRDRADATALRAAGCRPIVAGTLFDTAARAARAARQLLRSLES
jgi:LPPG:FO 2-phospho-L-lactate transferase